MLSVLGGGPARGVPCPEIAHAFFRTLSVMAVSAAAEVRDELSHELGATAQGISTVALAGEVWQSRLLLELTVPPASRLFEVLLPLRPPAQMPASPTVKPSSPPPASLAKG